jgi:hypothetical protein
MNPRGFCLPAWLPVLRWASGHASNFAMWIAYLLEQVERPMRDRERNR